MANIVLGVSGSVAAYRAADLARELMRNGHIVRVCLTDAAEQFVTRALFEALTGQPCLENVFVEPERGRMAHIDWARWADLVMVAPATANTLAKIAFGLGDDMLTTLVLAYERPVLLAPAMNPSMYANETTQEALRRVEARGCWVVEPTEGDVACGENGQGKLASIAAIVEAANEALALGQKLEGKRVVITSGPTHEAIDDVRFITNRSSGKMGVAMARVALWMGAEVTLITGPTAEPVPLRAQTLRVKTAAEMHDAALAEAGNADLFIGAAAVADYRPATKVHGKLRRTGDGMNLELVPNPDIIAAVAQASKGRVIGFAAEPTADLAIAQEKLVRKGLFAIAHNDVSQPGIGFEGDQNALTLLFADGRTETSGVRSKVDCAAWLLNLVAP